MKKILSFVLVLAMIASMMCVNVAAKDDLIGYINNNNYEGIKKGVDATTGEESYEVVASIVANKVPKYAVDLEYTSFTITITSAPEWNVTDMEYYGDVDVKTTSDTAEQTYDNVTADSKILVGTFKVVNHSDRAVDVSATAEKTTGLAAENMSIDFETTESGLAASITDTINGNERGAQDRQNATYSAYLTSSDWDKDVVDMLYANTVTNVKIATITFTITPNA